MSYFRNVSARLIARKIFPSSKIGFCLWCDNNSNIISCRWIPRVTIICNVLLSCLHLIIWILHIVIPHIQHLLFVRSFIFFCDVTVLCIFFNLRHFYLILKFSSWLHWSNFRKVYFMIHLFWFWFGIIFCGCLVLRFMYLITVSYQLRIDWMYFNVIYINIFFALFVI